MTCLIPQRTVVVDFLTSYTIIDTLLRHFFCFYENSKWGGRWWKDRVRKLKGRVWRPNTSLALNPRSQTWVTWCLIITLKTLNNNHKVFVDTHKTNERGKSSRVNVYTLIAWNVSSRPEMTEYDLFAMVNDQRPEASLSRHEEWVL